MTQLEKAIAIPTTASGNRFRLAYLDGLRGLAALYVVLVHVHIPEGLQPTPLWSAVSKLMQYGIFAVVVFIVLSGYCLMLPVVRSPHKRLSGGLVNYIKRRARRILPPYYAALFISLLIGGLILSIERLTNLRWNAIGLADKENLFSPYFSWQDVLSHLLLVHNLSPETHLSINRRAVDGSNRVANLFFVSPAAASGMAALGLMPAVAIAFLTARLPHFLFPDLLDPIVPWLIGIAIFSLGMAAADINFSPRSTLVKLRNTLPWKNLAIGLTGVSLLAEWLRFKTNNPIAYDWISQSFAGLATSCALIYLTNMAMNSSTSSRLLQVLETSWAGDLGKISYSLYLIHPPVLVVLYKMLSCLPLSPATITTACFLVGVPLCLLAASRFHWLFEQPFLSTGLQKRVQGS